MTPEESVKCAKDIFEVHQSVMDIMGWDESSVYQWMAAPIEELGLNSPAGLIIEGKRSTLDGFLAGMKMAITKNKENKDGKEI